MLPAVRGLVGENSELLIFPVSRKIKAPVAYDVSMVFYSLTEQNSCQLGEVKKKELKMREMENGNGMSDIPD